MKWNGLPVVIFGSGAMSQEAGRILCRINGHSHLPVFDFRGYIDNKQEVHTHYGDIVCGDEAFVSYAQGFDLLGVVIPFSDYALKERIFSYVKTVSNVVFPNLIDPDALFFDMDTVTMGVGNVIEPGVIINSRVCMGDFNLLNIRAVVGHDCVMGDFCSVQPGAILSGCVTLADRVLIGAGAVVKQGLCMGEGAVLGLGAFTVKDIESGEVMVCAQAKPIKNR